MKKPTRHQAFSLGALVLCAGLWGASQWWEKALATPVYDADFSPNGCYRLQAFEPFWILPNDFHPHHHPDESFESQWFVPWETRPVFFRLYKKHTGELIGESGIYDLKNYGGPIMWGYGKNPSVFVGMIEVGNDLPDCSED